MEAVNPKVPNPDLENMMQIALASLEAGEGLPDIAESRGMEAVPYKYGMHLGNWTDGGSSGLERELEATLPTSVLFMDNVKGQPLNLQLERLKAKGVKPILIYRPYFAPSSGTSGGAIENYANGAFIRFRDEYLPHDLIEEAYHEGRVIFKLFNETNIGGEGFARGRAGFADALRCWKQARSIVKASFPLAKFMSIANTPGNDDVYFSGDALNLPYWYHGAEAAKANPTASEIQAAINSCPYREMFQLCDVIGIHVYAQDERQTRGDLQTWYGRRHEQALKFLQPYIAQGKKMIISEWDCGYDQQPNPQQARAELCVWWLANVVGPNAAILTTNHWWNSDDGEGAITWEKHQTRKGGEFRPVVNAVANFRSGATVPPVEPPIDPEPIPPSGSDLPSWVMVNRVVVPAGGQYWKLNSAYWQDHDESGGTHHIYITQPHDPTKSFNVSNGQGNWNVPLDKPSTEPAGNFAMWAGNVYTAKMNGLPSDSVSGMKMPESQHVSYYLEYQLETMTNPTPPQPETWQQALIAELDHEQETKGIRLNPQAAIQKVMAQQSFVPVVSESGFNHPQKSYPATQKGERLSDGAERYYTWSGSEGTRWIDPVPIAPPPSQLVINHSRKSNNFDERPANYKPMVLQYHHTGGGLVSSLNHLCNDRVPLKDRVSSHYVIGKQGQIYQLVDESKRAWHSGYGIHKGRENPNDYTISFEIENKGDGVDPYPQVQIDAVVALSRDVVQRNQIIRSDTTTHKKTRAAWKAKYPDVKGVSFKNDPSPNFPLEEVLNRVYG